MISNVSLASTLIQNQNHQSHEFTTYLESLIQESNILVRHLRSTLAVEEVQELCHFLSVMH